MPRTVLRRLSRRYIGAVDYQLATGGVVRVGQWRGTIVIGRRSYPAIFMEGDWLLGMEFIETACRSLHIDCISGKVILRLRH